MARAVLFGTPVSPGIAIGRVRFMHKARQDDERRITAADVAAEQETLRASFGRAQQQVGVIESREQQHRGVVVAVTQRLHGGDAVHARHADVAQHHVH